MKLSFRVLTYFLVLLSLSACGGLETKDRLSRLSDSVNSYSGAIRWQRFGDAYQFHLNRDGTKPKVDYTLYEEVKVTAYKIVEQGIDTENMESKVTAIIKYYRDDTGTVESLTHQQTWWFSEESKRWVVDAAFPVFK